MNFAEAYEKFGRTDADRVEIKKDDEDTLYQVDESTEAGTKVEDVGKIDLKSLSDEDVSRIAKALFEMQNPEKKEGE